MENKMICAKCKKRIAVVFISKLENGQNINEGYCLKCAKDMNIPHIDSILKRFGMTEDDIDTLSDQMTEMFDPDENFEVGGAQPLAPFIENVLNSMNENKNEDNKIAEIKNEENEENENFQDSPRRQKKLKFLSMYCDNLTQKARNNRLDGLIGRDREMERITQILNRRQKNNPCLIGDPGVGKTAIAEGIAAKLATNDVPYRLKGKELYLLDLTALVAGTQFRGQFESRIKGLIEEVKREGNIILFIDEIHNLIGSGSAEGSMNAANIMKPALSRGEIQVIGATTFNEYRKYIEKDAALERRFQPVAVNEPSIEDSITILKGIKKYYENFHRIKISDEIAEKCVTLSERYITDRFLPDKAIDLMDEASSCCVLRNPKLGEYDSIKQKISEKAALLETLETDGEPQFEKIAQLKAEIAKLRDEAMAIEVEALNYQLSLDDLTHVIELWTSIPASKVKESEVSKVKDLANMLKVRIIGQDEAVEKVALAVKRTRIRLTDVKRPASFIFVGPTGVGKTELVRRLAEAMFNSTEPLIRVDMTEYMEKHTVSRLVGSPPGYVGYDEAGQLTEKVRRKPYSVVLFDEIEKAHPDVLNIMLQILDEGFVTDAQGRKVDFSNTIIVMTSNAGSNLNSNSLGFDKTDDQKSMDKTMKALREFLRPEFLGRVDEIVLFKHLTIDSLEKIAHLQLSDIKESLKQKDVSFSWNTLCEKDIANEGLDSTSGARELRRIIRNKVEDPITTLLLDNGIDNIKGIYMDKSDSGFTFTSI